MKHLLAFTAISALLTVSNIASAAGPPHFLFAWAGDAAGVG
jgi:hypothetical protein